MRDIVFTVVGRWAYELQEGTQKVNKFLQDNEDYEVKSITPITRPGNDENSFTGMIFVLSERKIKRIKENKE